jgi:hypothetical protein
LVRLRAEIRAGELLAEMQKNKGTCAQLRGDIPVGGSAPRPPTDTAPKLSDLVLTKSQSSRWQQLAARSRLERRLVSFSSLDTRSTERKLMAVRRTIKTTVLTLKRDSRIGEPFGTLVSCIEEAWAAIPPEYRESSGFEISQLTVWYHRPEADEDMRERAEYERLKAKFENISYE